MVGRAGEVDDGDRISAHVAQPAHRCFGRNLQLCIVDVEVVPLARTEHRGVRAEGYGLLVEIRCLVKNAQAVHGFRGWAKRANPASQQFAPRTLLSARPPAASSACKVRAVGLHAGHAARYFSLRSQAFPDLVLNGRRTVCRGRFAGDRLPVCGVRGDRTIDRDCVPGQRGGSAAVVSFRQGGRAGFLQA